METHVCEKNVHTELILSSCYGVHQGASRWDSEGGHGGGGLLDKEGRGKGGRASELCDTHTHTHTDDAVGARTSKSTFTPPQGFPSGAERRQSLRRGSSKKRKKKEKIPSSSQRQDLELFVLRVEEALQPVRVGEVCGSDVTGHFSDVDGVSPRKVNNKPVYEPGVRLMASTLTMCDG